MPAHQRGPLLEERKQELARRIALESAKPWRYTFDEVGRAVETFKFAAIEVERLHGEMIPMDAARGSEKRRGFFIRQPLGIIVVIPPFNFPLNLMTKVAKAPPSK